MKDRWMYLLYTANALVAVAIGFQLGSILGGGLAFCAVVGWFCAMLQKLRADALERSVDALLE